MELKKIFALILSVFMLASAASVGYAKEVVDDSPKAVRMLKTVGQRGLTTFIRYFGGSGFYIKGGYVITSAHMVTDDNMDYDIDDGINRTYATLIAKDKMRDLALFKVPYGADHEYFEIAESVINKELVSAIGNTEDKQNVKQSGTITELSRHTPLSDPKTFDILSYNARMFIDMPTVLGNSGSPVLNKDGKVVGVVIGLVRERKTDLGGKAVCVTLEDVKEFLSNAIPKD